MLTFTAQTNEKKEDWFVLGFMIAGILVVALGVSYVIYEALAPVSVPQLREAIAQDSAIGFRDCLEQKLIQDKSLTERDLSICRDQYPTAQTLSTTGRKQFAVLEASDSKGHN